VNQEEVVDRIRLDLYYLARIGGTQESAAKSLGISPQYLSDVLKGRREPGPKVLKALGLVRKVTYERSKQDD